MSVHSRIRAANAKLPSAVLSKRYGQICEVRGHILRAQLPKAALGMLCRIETATGPGLLAEVTAIAGQTSTLSPFDDVQGLEPGARVEIVANEFVVPIGNSLLGRVVDSFLNPIDGGDAPAGPFTTVPARNGSETPMSRPLIDTVFETGIRVIDGMCTLGQGQRISIFGSPGTGKTSFIGMLAQHSTADVVVVALVGERGREVREFAEDVLPEALRSNSVIVTATSDQSPMLRALCVQSATAVAEHFRDQGLNVLLLVDSLTRVARALREIGLASGEAPTRRGYPSSVYPALPAIVERAGRTGVGSITALYTVLTEGEIESDPIAEEVKSLTDGHIVLSRKLAASGQYPAVDVLASLSRSMNRVASAEHQGVAAQVRAQIAKYDEIEMLIQVGEYKDGADPEADRAIKNRPLIQTLLRQASDEPTPLDKTLNGLRKIAQ